MKMKFVIIIISVFLLISGCIVVVEELTYSPLTENDFKNLFPNYDNSAKKKCNVDFIGLSLHGELFDIFTYELTDVTIDSSYPSINDSWTNITASDELVISAWKRIPVDSLTLIRCKDIFDLGNYRGNKCCSSFVSELSNSINFYSYVYVNELEYYFCLYCPNKHYLYYVRKRG